MPVGPVIALIFLIGLMLSGCASEGEVIKAQKTNNDEFKDAVKKKEKTTDTPCTCDACVVCTNATSDSVPVHMKNKEGLVHLGDIVELNKTNIEVEKSFEGCTKSLDGKCKIDINYKEWIEDGEWKDVDDLTNQGTGKETLNREKSYMFCREYAGIIYFYNDGQEVKHLINGELIFYLSDDYLQWLEKAEGFTPFPYLDTQDSAEAQSRQNVTLGIGFTFDNTGRNWDVLKEVLGWTDADINLIINGVYSGADYSNSCYTITKDQAYEMFSMVAERTYMTNLNAAISAYNVQKNCVITYSQRELEAMFDYSYNNGLSPSQGKTYSLSINDPDQIIYYYLRKDRINAVSAVKKFGGGNRRRLNQMNLFFFDYNFLDKSGKDLDPLRQKLGF